MTLSPSLPSLHRTAMSTTLVVAWSCAALAPTAPVLSAGEAWDAVVRGTDARTPAEERTGFHLPPGFEIQLVASEPEIQKPMNMAFDAQGRLWLTDTREYPFPVKDGEKGRDTVKVLSDFAPDGKARKITTFADGLNIPIGIYPYRDGAIVHSMPAIWRLIDSDGDGVCDKRERLYGDIGRDDTHGQTNAFRRGFDGWLYAAHGFKNKSTITGSDGSRIVLESGNTYRMRLDGSHVEQFTWGQVNPFGLAFDEIGNLYSSDCHSKPVFQLLRGGHYMSFSPTDDGLGLAPEMMGHMHGSTALCGICYYAAENFPPAFRGNMLICNVVTSRINRDTLTTRGSTRTCIEAPDFLSSDDPWFRPVDMQIAPDGSLYVADFYNKIIGHYEIDLKDPRRDRTSGRVWRIVYTGTDGSRPGTIPDLAKASVDALVSALADPTITTRELAVDQLTDRIGAAAVPAVTTAVKGGAVRQRLHGTWVLERLGALDASLLATLAGDADAGVRRQAIAVLAERAAWSDAERQLASTALTDGDAFVRRTAADALGRHAQADAIKPLLATLAAVPGEDTHLRHVVRMALRDQLRSPGMFARLDGLGLDAGQRDILGGLAQAVGTPDAAVFLLTRLGPDADDRLVKAVTAQLPEAQIGDLVNRLRGGNSANQSRQMALLTLVDETLRRRGIAASEALRPWATTLTDAAFAAAEREQPSWTSQRLENSKSADPWDVQRRDSADGDRGSPFFSSLPRGETLTGMLRSPPFAIPATLTFFVAGHNGPPDRNDPPKNLIRLRDAATGALLMETVPPRNDIAQPVKWDLAPHAGKQGILELVDGDTGNGYAWLAVGRFTPAVVAVALDSGDLRRAADLAKAFRLSALAPRLATVVADAKRDPDTRGAAANALVAVDAEGAIPRLGTLLNDPQQPADVRERLATALGSANLPAANALIAGAIAGAPAKLQAALARALVSNAAGGGLLLTLVADGKAPPRLLLDRAISDRLVAGDQERSKRVAELTKGVAPVAAEREQIISKRAQEFRAATTDPKAGAKLFATNCAVCHRLDGQGALIGPQLDGAGKRGADRLLEDILDPSRNVDRAFRLSVITLDDGRLLNGFVRREEGGNLIVADITGNESAVAKTTVKSVSESATSLMRDDFALALPAQDLFDLVAFLLAH